MVRGVVRALELLPREARFRAARLRLVLTDVDGVLTDGGVFYSAQGEVGKRFDVRDGMGVERLRADGVETAFFTREDSPAVARRAEKLRVRCYGGVADKLAALPALLAERGLELGHVAYIGDDVNDVDVMAAIAARGLVAAPADSQSAAAALAHLRCAQPGGHGAFRELAEWILNLRAEARAARDGEMRPGSS